MADLARYKRPDEVYSIYAPGTPTVAAQDKMTTAVVAPIRRAVDDAVTMTGGKLVQRGINALAATSAANDAAVNRYNLQSGIVDRRNELMRESTLPGGVLPPQPVVAADPPVPAGLQRDGIQSAGWQPAASPVASQNDLAIKDSIAKIDAAIAGGMRPSAEQAQRIAAIKQQAGFLRGSPSGPTGTRSVPLQARTGGIRRVGNMDVQFAPGTDAAAQSRFLENPVRPTAQINRFNASRGLDAGQGIRAAQNADRILDRPPQGGPGPTLLTRENSPGMGWKQRSKLNEQLLANEQSGQNARLQSETSFGTAGIQADTSRLGFRNQREIAAAGDAVQMDRNKILASEAESQNAYRGVQAAELPKENASQQAERSARAEQAAATTAGIRQATEQGKLMKFSREVPNSVDPKFGVPMKQEGFYNPLTEKTIIPGELGMRSAAPAVPQDASQLVVGQTYTAANGSQVIWDGKGFKRISN